MTQRQQFLRQSLVKYNILNFSNVTDNLRVTDLLHTYDYRETKKVNAKQMFSRCVLQNTKYLQQFGHQRLNTTAPRLTDSTFLELGRERGCGKARAKRGTTLKKVYMYTTLYPGRNTQLTLYVMCQARKDVDLWWPPE